MLIKTLICADTETSIFSFHAIENSYVASFVITCFRTVIDEMIAVLIKIKRRGLIQNNLETAFAGC